MPVAVAGRDRQIRVDEETYYLIKRLASELYTSEREALRRAVRRAVEALGDGR